MILPWCEQITFQQINEIRHRTLSCTSYIIMNSVNDSVVQRVIIVLRTCSITTRSERGNGKIIDYK